MSYNPATDFVGLWRAIAGGVEKAELPGLDFMVSALGRSGLINVSTSSIAPVANQATTAWFQPASPSYSAEGGLNLWNGAAYVAATPRLFLEMLAAAEKAAASSTAISSLLDTLGSARGDIAVRGASGWQALAPGTLGYLLTSGGAGADLTWSTIGSIGGALDSIGNVQGDILYRGAAGWAALAPGTAGQLLASGGAAANPAWETFPGVATVNKQVFTGSGTYTPTTGMLYAIIECVGGGGGGGGNNAVIANQGAGGGGGGGSYARKFVTASDIGASKTVTIGAGGAGGTAASGSNGNDTSVGVLCIGKGGSGGGGGVGGQPGGAGGIAGTGDFTSVGGAGGGGNYFVGMVASIIITGPNGGVSGGGFGGGGLGGSGASSATSNGSAGGNYGGGGGGGTTNNVSANSVGGAGAGGAVVITEFCSQ